ncbi:MAG: hypothetical protein R2728_12130 [Chitinophagales bacterium]
MRNLMMIIAAVFLMVSCTTESKEQKLVKSYEANAGNEIKFKSFEFLKSFTFKDSLAIWQDSLDINRKEYLAIMDSAEIHLDKAYEAAVEGKISNTFKMLEDQFDQVIKDVEINRLKIEINRANANEKGENTPLAKYFQKVEEMESKKDELIYNIFKGEMVIDGEPKTKLYYLDSSNETVVATVAE